MFRRKITRKLTLFVTTSLVLLMEIVVAVQFLIVSSNYMTTKYAKTWVNDLLETTDLLMDRYLAAKGNSSTITSVLNRYAEENSCCCLILNKSYIQEATMYNNTIG